MHFFSLKKIIFLLLTTTSITKIYSHDSITISGKFINNTRFANVVLKKFEIGILDVAAAKIEAETGRFTIKVGRNIKPGIYRLQYSHTDLSRFLDVVINGIDSEISFIYDLNPNAKNKYPEFIESPENKELYQTLNELNDILTKIEISGFFLKYYPDQNDKIFRKISLARNLNITKYHKIKSIASKNPNFYWLRHTLSFMNHYFTNPLEHPRIQRFKQQQSFWNTLPTQDTLLLNTPLYSDAILRYIQYYVDPIMEFSEGERIEGMKKAIDTIIFKFSKNSKTREFAWKYLQLGFKEIGQEDILKYIDLNYGLSEQCKEQNNDNEDFLERIRGYNELAPGKNAPKFELSIENKKINLDSFSGKSILLVFWASWCPHCREVMPKVNTWAIENINTLVLAISLDTTENEFSLAKQELPNLIHYSDFKQWKSEIVKLFYISATPTFILIDKDRKILGKYSSLDALITSKNQ